MSEGNGKIISMNGAKPRDIHGRVLSHNATIKDVYDIVAQETAKVHEHYLNQIPKYTANMIMDALVDQKLIPEFRPDADQTEIPLNAAPCSDEPSAA